MLKLPWRSTFLIGMEAVKTITLNTTAMRFSDFAAGQDLRGNTFWEFKDKMNANRVRRIVRPRGGAHFSDVTISPQWHQWLRHTRHDAPTIQDQQADIGRQAQLKYLAQQADERWASKPSFLDRPREQPQPATLPLDPRSTIAPRTEADQNEGVKSAVDNPVSIPDPPKTTENPDPSKRTPTGRPSEQWEPQSWNPGSAKSR